MRRGGMRGDARQHLHSRGILARLAKPVLDLRGAPPLPHCSINRNGVAFVAF
jgi:hypothetical protein